MSTLSVAKTGQYIKYPKSSIEEALSILDDVIESFEEIENRDVQAHEDAFAVFQSVMTFRISQGTYPAEESAKLSAEFQGIFEGAARLYTIRKTQQENAMLEDLLAYCVYSVCQFFLVICLIYFVSFYEHLILVIFPLFI